MVRTLFVPNDTKSNISANTHHRAWKPGSSFEPTDIKHGFWTDESFNRHFLSAGGEYLVFLFLYSFFLLLNFINETRCGVGRG